MPYRLTTTQEAANEIPYRIGALVFGVGLVLSACSTGGYGSSNSGAKTAPTTARPTASAGVVKTAQTSLGTILVDAQGRRCTASHRT